MNWTTAGMGLRGNQEETRKTDPSKLTLGKVRGGKF